MHLLRYSHSNAMVSGIGYLHLVPVCLCILGLTAFFTAYGIAVNRGDVNALLPYISDAGGRPPESCIFGQFLNLSAALAFIAMYVHYKHIKEFNITNIPTLHKVNTASLWIAMFACLGMSMVANFQVYNALIPHMIGAFLVFGLGVTYCWLQTYISHKMIGNGMSSRLSCYGRFILSGITSICFFLTIIAGPVSVNQYDERATHLMSYRREWTHGDPGYALHLVSTFSEWIMGITFLFYFLTYYREFQKIVVVVKIEPKDAEIFSSEFLHDESGTIEV